MKGGRKQDIRVRRPYETIHPYGKAAPSTQNRNCHFRIPSFVICVIILFCFCWFLFAVLLFSERVCKFRFGDRYDTSTNCFWASPRYNRTHRGHQPQGHAVIRPSRPPSTGQVSGELSFTVFSHRPISPTWGEQRAVVFSHHLAETKEREE